MSKVQNILDDNISGMAGKLNWHSYWQELADVLLPKRADITHGVVDGGDRHSTVYDGSPIRACRGMAKSIDSITKPKTSQWFFISATEDELNDNDEAKRWFTIVQNRMWKAIYSRKARFVQRTGEVDLDLSALGTGALFIGESKKLQALNFRAFHPKDILIFENEDGVVDKIHITQRYNARQAIRAYGENNVSEIVKESLKDSGNKMHEFIIAIAPREDRRIESLLSKDLPFEHIIVEKDAESIVHESGFHEFPCAVPRWETASGEVYGRSPGMVALPDSKTLQAMGKTMLIAGQKSVDPPLVVVDDALIGGAKTFPGGMSVIDSEAARALGGNPIFPLEMGKNVLLGAEMQNEKRQAVEAAFFRNVFSLPVDGPQMTATEIIQRKEEFVREIGPVFGQLESEYIAPIVERVFGIMLRAGAFPEPPEILQGQNVEFEINSPVQRMRKQIEAAAASQAITSLAPFVEADPSIMDNFDGDKIARSTPDAFGVPMDWIRPIEERDGLREQRAQAQANADAMQQSQVMGEIAKNVG